MAQYGFGAGTLIAIPNLSVPTPTQFGALQDVEIDFDFTTKELYGAYQFPLAIGRGQAKITGKASIAQIRTRVYNDIFFNEPSEPSADQVIMALAEAHSVPASSTYTVTVTNAADYINDLGVTYAVGGNQLMRVASVAAAGEYSVDIATGVYTFYSADASAALLFNYQYTVDSGVTMTITNQLLGASPTFSINLQNTFDGNILTMTLNKCISSKLTFPFKQVDFVMNDFEFSAFADDSGNIGTISASQ